MLDIWGEERATGKSLGTDLEKQKLTIPIIRLLETGEPETVELARRLLNEAKAESRRADSAPARRVRLARLLVGESPLVRQAGDRGARRPPPSDSKAVLVVLAEYVVRSDFVTPGPHRFSRLRDPHV